LLVNGDEFVKKVRRIAKRQGCRCEFDARHGKGSHGQLLFGDRLTTVKDRKKEIGDGLLSAMLKQLGLTKDDLT
jgi:mRNA interferase HicA